MKREPYIDADYRVLGEGRWGPFRRWVAEMWWKFRVSVIGEEAASWQWWVQAIYVVAIVGLLVGAYAFAHWFNGFLRSLF